MQITFVKVTANKEECLYFKAALVPYSLFLPYASLLAINCSGINYIHNFSIWYILTADLCDNFDIFMDDCFVVNTVLQVITFNLRQEVSCMTDRILSYFRRNVMHLVVLAWKIIPTYGEHIKHYTSQVRTCSSFNRLFARM